MTFGLYPKDFNIDSNKGCLHLIVRTILVVPIILIFAKLNPKMYVLIYTVLLLGLAYLADKYLRLLYPDWPSPSKFIGKIDFRENEIEIISKSQEIIGLDQILELVFFVDHYKGYTASSRDIRRNGNSLVFIKKKDGQSVHFKFNIDNKTDFQEFNRITEQYPNHLSYFKRYLTNEVSFILKPDYSERIKYN